MAAYYNENDTFAAAWLRELIKAGLIADGEVDERSIQDVAADDVRGFVQCHFFAGIGGWSYALRLAGWPDDRAVWTGSCPCQPFSAAGAQAGGHDPRDLWPTWYQLLRECRPVCVFGEQVEAAIAHGWLDRVCDDLEREGYAVGACGLPAASVGAFHLRQRLWFVADTEGARGRQYGGAISGAPPAGLREQEGQDERWTVWEARRACDCQSDGDMGHANGAGHEIRDRQRSDDGVALHQATGEAVVEAGALGHAEGGNRKVLLQQRRSQSRGVESGRPSGSGFWSDAEWIACSDGKTRAIEPTIFPLAHGVSNRVGLLRGAGNAIVPQVAQVFIEAYLSLERS